MACWEDDVKFNLKYLQLYGQKSANKGFKLGSATYTLLPQNHKSSPGGDLKPGVSKPGHPIDF